MEPSRGMKRAVVYARVSSKEQEREGFSIPAQLKLLRAYADEHLFEVTHEFVDVETAKTTGRTGFGEMLSVLRKTRAVMLVEKTDRLYRNLKDWVTVDQLDLEIHFVKENFILSQQSRSSEKLVHGIKVLMAKNYIDNLSEETRKGLREKAEQGGFPGRPPLGYRRTVGVSGKSIIEPDPDVAPIILKIFEAYATDQYSVRDVTKLAREAGLRFRGTGSPIKSAAVHQILRNRIYTGDFDWNGQRFKGTHSPIVSYELWEKAQAILDQRSENRLRRTKRDFLFSRLVACGHCGSAMVAEIKKGKYVYYHCTGWRGKCNEPYVREELLRDKFKKVLEGLVVDDATLEWLRRELRASERDTNRYQDEAIARLEHEITRLQNRIERMYLDKLRDRRTGDVGARTRTPGQVTERFFDAKTEEWRAEQARIGRTIDEHRAAGHNYIEQGVRILEVAQEAHRSLSDRGERARASRTLLSWTLSNCHWAKGELATGFRQPFGMLAEAVAAARREDVAGLGPGDICPVWRGGRDSNAPPDSESAAIQGDFTNHATDEVRQEARCSQDEMQNDTRVSKIIAFVEELAGRSLNIAEHARLLDALDRLHR